MEFLQWRSYLLNWKCINTSKHILHCTLSLTAGRFEVFDRHRRIASVTTETDGIQSKTKELFRKTAPNNWVQRVKKEEDAGTVLAW